MENQIDIVIPTYGRQDNQETLKQLVAAGIKPILVVQHREIGEGAYWEYRKDADIYVLPDEIRTIAPTRQHILDSVGDSNQLCMVDDDLTFYHRREDDASKLREITPDELRQAFTDLEMSLKLSYAHVGFAAREGANRNTSGVVENTRIMRVLGYSRPALKAIGARFDEMEVMEDFHVALSLLENGYKNAILNMYAHNQAGSGRKGGCSHFRTPQLQEDNALKLHALHTKYVSVVEKTTKGAWGGGVRTDVRVQWKKAWDESNV